MTFVWVMAIIGLAVIYLSCGVVTAAVASRIMDGQPLEEDDGPYVAFVIGLWPLLAVIGAVFGAVSLAVRAGSLAVRAVWIVDTLIDRVRQ